MAWSAPMTAVANTAFTAAQFNTYVRDNLNQTAPAKATTAGTIFVGTGSNSIAERFPSTDIVNTTQTTSNTSYVNLGTTGPTVTVQTGVSALVFIQCRIRNTTSTNTAFASYALSGATSMASDDNRCISSLGETNAGGDYTGSFLHTTGTSALTAGSNTFTMKYRVGGGEGEYSRRRIIVIPL